MVVQDNQLTGIILLLFKCLYIICFGFPDLNSDFENMEFLSQCIFSERQWISREARKDKCNPISFCLIKAKHNFSTSYGKFSQSTSFSHPYWTGTEHLDFYFSPCCAERLWSAVEKCAVGRQSSAWRSTCADNGSPRISCVHALGWGTLSLVLCPKRGTKRRMEQHRGVAVMVCLKQCR